MRPVRVATQASYVPLTNVHDHDQEGQLVLQWFADRLGGPKQVFTISFNKAPCLYIAVMRLRAELGISSRGVQDNIHTPSLNNNAMIFLTLSNSDSLGGRGERLFFG